MNWVVAESIGLSGIDRSGPELGGQGWNQLNGRGIRWPGLESIRLLQNRQSRSRINWVVVESIRLSQNQLIRAGMNWVVVESIE
jgi:hypothetical protein